ncbi:hypothetical protein [Kibdelosporangium aridum]|uniref:hypothetical protein n=1 Tax=Kibdelosporangium aridum TaxID=2030 RepID=UPI001358A5C6|nr:hypothetical protein [Kibdelosporangium aridum]
MLDVRAVDRIKPRDQVAFDARAEACETLGCRYEIAGVPPVSLLKPDLRFTSGC